VGRSFRPESLTFGLLLVATGVVWTAANLGKLDLLTTLRTWWPGALVLWGVLEVVAFALGRTGGNR